jgi:hypothetical protein
MTRTVTLVLLDFDGEIAGRSESFEVGTPWWQEVGDVAQVVEQRYGLAVDVLRLLSTERPRPHGGAVTYLAQARIPIEFSLAPVDPQLVELIEQDEPRRAAYARPGGPAASLAWAAEILGPVTAVHLRTWNLSAIWRLHAGPETYWLKQLPGWLRSEPAALRWLGEVVPDLAPVVIAEGDQGRELLADVPGIDHYGADRSTRLRIVEQAHRFQTAALTDIDRLLADGVPDRRGPCLTAWIRASLKGWAEASPAASLLAGLDERMAAVAHCGLPDTLVHGDAHPGNTRGDGARLVFLDWGECFLGHPAFDALGLVGDLPPDEAGVILDAWATGWRQQVPGCDPARALELLRPIMLLRSAAVYAEFVANIEPAEQSHHSFDVPDSLEAAAASDE